MGEDRSPGDGPSDVSRQAQSVCKTVQKTKGSRRDGVFDTWTRSKCVIVECGLHFGNVFENCGIVLRHSFMIYSLFLDF